MFRDCYCSSCTPRSFFFILENRLIGYADDSTLFSVVLSTCVRVAVAESPNRDLGNFSVRCDLWGMKLNASKTETTIVSRSCTKHPHTHPINYWRNCAEGVWWPDILGVTFDPKVTFESIFAGFPEQLLKGLLYWGSPRAGCWKRSAITYVAADGVRHLKSPATYNQSSFRFKWRSFPWGNLRQVRRCLRISYAIAGGSGN